MLTSSDIRNILFIGNSFTYFNDMPRMLQQLVDPKHEKYDFDMVTRGGAYLHDYTAESGELVSRLNAKRIWQKWDAVIFQDQSINPALNPEDLKRAAIKLKQQFDCPVYLYETWAYENGSSALAETGMTYDEMWLKLKEGYEAAAEAIGARVVPVGDAFRYISGYDPDTVIYHVNDHKHPAIAGSYLAAMMFAGHLCGIKPDALPYPAYLPEAYEKALKKAACACLSQPE